MSVRITSATALRLLRQLRRDPRTIAMLLVVPPLLVTILKYAFEHQPRSLQLVGGPLVGLFPFITMFLVTSITMLRERTTGTLERLMTMPLAKLDLLLGYGIAFAAVATLQALIRRASTSSSPTSSRFGSLDAYRDSESSSTPDVDPARPTAHQSSSSAHQMGT
jgi:ABC-2 type transport system permease protein